MATPYAHSFCDKFLGALRHTTPSILRQRGSAATLYHNGILFYRLGHHAPLQKLETPHEQH